MSELTSKLSNFINRVRCIPNDGKIRCVDSSDAESLWKMLLEIEKLEFKAEILDALKAEGVKNWEGYYPALKGVASEPEHIPDYLRNLASRLQHMPGADEWDIDRLIQISSELEKRCLN